MISLQTILNYFKPKEKVKLVDVNLSLINKALPAGSTSSKKDGVIYLGSSYDKYVMDEDYSSCSVTVFKELLKNDFTNWKIYHKDYDCDNFAFKLHSNLKDKYPTLALGIVFSKAHAFNIFIDKFGKAHYIEPQNDKIYSFNQLTKLYDSIKLILI